MSGILYAAIARLPLTIRERVSEQILRNAGVRS